MWTDDDDASLKSGSAVRHGDTRGDTGGDLEGQQAFATAVVAVEDCDTSDGETFVPEPANGLGFSVGEIVLVDGKGAGSRRRR